MSRLLTSRLILAPLSGAIVSLSLLALYQQSSTASTRQLSHAAARADEAVEDAKQRLSAKLNKEEQRVKQQAEEMEGLRESRWNVSRPRYESIGDQLKSRWNHHLVSLSESINHVRWDDVVDSLLTRTAALTSNAASAVGNAASSSKAGSDLANKAESMTLRTADEVQRKVEEAAGKVKGAVGGAGASASLR